MKAHAKAKALEKKSGKGSPAAAVAKVPQTGMGSPLGPLARWVSLVKRRDLLLCDEVVCRDNSSLLLSWFVVFL